MAEQDKQQRAAVFNSKTEKSTEKKQKWSLKKKLWVIFGGLAATFIVLFIVVSLATSAPVKVSNDLVTDIQSDNTSAAYSLMSSGAKTATDEASFNSIIDRISPILAGKPKMLSKEVKGETGSAATAKVVYRIHGTDGIDYTFTVNLTKDNGAWKVQNFESKK